MSGGDKISSFAFTLIQILYFKHTLNNMKNWALLNTLYATCVTANILKLQNAVCVFKDIFAVLH